MNAPPQTPRTYILAGGSGFLGTVLARALAARGDVPVILTRVPARWRGPGRAEAWDGRTVGPWAGALDGAAGVVNLTGTSVNCRHTPANKARILASRLDSVRALAEAMKICAAPPPVWVQMSGSGYFGDTGDRPCAEDTPPGGDFLAQVCIAWEAALAAHKPAGTRGVVLRPSLVIGEQGALPLLVRYTRLWLGSAAGSGRQYLPWIHQADMVGVFLSALDDARWSGPFNICAPEERTNAQFMADLRHVLHRPWVPPAPAFAVRLVARLTGTHPDLVLFGHRMRAQKLAEVGFQFRFPALRGALEDLLN